MRRYALRDDQWSRIEHLLPGRPGSVGVTAADNRLFVEAVLFRYRAGIPWRDLPERFGDWKNVHRRFSRWTKRGVWKRLFELLAEEADNEYAMIDSTIVRAHQHSAGAQKNVWPAPSARVISDGVLVCINVSGLRASSLAKMGSARSGPHKDRGVEHHIFSQAAGTPVRPLSHLSSTSADFMRGSGVLLAAIVSSGGHGLLIVSAGVAQHGPRQCVRALRPVPPQQHWGAPA